jgi:uncharacterized Zn-finger protein
MQDPGGRGALRAEAMRFRYGVVSSDANSLRAPMTDPAAPPAPETILVTSKRVKCDGGGGALGHPVVFYDMGEDDFVECLYCDRRFELQPGHGHGH